MADPLEEFLGAARAALPPVEGELRVPGPHEPVEVLRDRLGESLPEGLKVDG